MKIIEILQTEGIGADLKKDAGDAVKGIGRGINAFVQGAGGPDIKGTFDKYAGSTLKGDPDKGSRGVGAGSGLDQILGSIYGKNLTDEIRSDWEDAIRSGDEAKIKAVNDKYENTPGIRPEAQSETNPGKLKIAHRNRIYALAGLSDENL